VNPIYQEMLRYAREGVSVLPIDTRTKRPAASLLPIMEDPETGEVGPSWKPFQIDIAGASQLARWGNVKAFASVCGKVSGGRVVIDFDNKPAGTADRFFAAWLESVGSLAEGLPVSGTQGDGYQVAFRMASPIGNEKLAWTVNDDEETGRSVAIETRGKGGYQVNPPSIGPNGTYRIISGDFAKPPLLSPAHAKALLDAARALDEAPYTRQEMQSAAAVPTRTDRVRPSLNGHASVIDAYNECHDVRSVLESFGYTRHGKRMLRPGASPTSEPGVTFTTRNGKEIAYCHSTNDPLHGPHAHDAFSVCCQLRHGGEFKAAVRIEAANMGLPPASAKAEGCNKAPASIPATVAATKAPVELPAEWRPFPVDKLPNAFARFVREADRALQIDGAFVALPLLAAAGAAIGNTHLALIKSGFTQPAVLWAAPVALSGEGKSPGMREALQFVWKTQNALHADYQGKQADYQAEKVQWEAVPKKERTAAEPIPPMLEHVVITDATTEAIAVRLWTSSRGLLSAPDELAGLFRGFNAYKKGGGDVESWLGFYDAGAVKIDRKTALVSTIILPRAFVGLCGGIQPGVLASIFNDEHFDSGLSARFLFAMPPGRQRTWNEEVVSDDVRSDVARVFEALYALPLEMDGGDIRPTCLPLTDDAKKLWGAWFNEIEAERSRATEETPYITALPKIRSAAVRLALIFQIVSHVSGECLSDSSIHATNMARGIELARWFKHEQSRVYKALAMSKADRALARLVQSVRDMGGRVSVRDWQRKRSLKSREDAESELQSIIDHRLASWGYDQNENGGRPSKFVTLNDITPADDAESEGYVCQTTTDIKRGNSLSLTPQPHGQTTDDQLSNSNSSDTDITPGDDIANEGSVISDAMNPSEADERDAVRWADGIDPLVGSTEGVI
jgi:hypothetical protein